MKHLPFGDAYCRQQLQTLRTVETTRAPIRRFSPLRRFSCAASLWLSIMKNNDCQPLSFCKNTHRRQPTGSFGNISWGRLSMSLRSRTTYEPSTSSTSTSTPHTHSERAASSGRVEGAAALFKIILRERPSATATLSERSLSFICCYVFFVICT